MSSIYIESRHSDCHEIELMQRVIDSLPYATKSEIASAFCDSKACAAYTITLKGTPASEDSLRLIGRSFKKFGGFNWLEVVDNHGRTIKNFGAWWPEFD